MSVKLEAKFLMTEIFTDGKILDKRRLAGTGFTHFDKSDMNCI